LIQRFRHVFIAHKQLIQWAQKAAPLILTLIKVFPTKYNYQVAKTLVVSILFPNIRRRIRAYGFALFMASILID
jgi:hypothetical protein